MTPAAFIFAQALNEAEAGVVGGTGARAIILGLLTGIAFGAILQRVGASSYEMIVNMLRLKDLTIMKFLFLAVAVGSVGMYLVDTTGAAHIGIAPVYLIGISVGGIIFGVGWALAGYCPGTALVAMAEGKSDAALTVLGGLAGAFALSLTWAWIRPVLVDPLNYSGRSIPDLIGTRPLVVALVLAVLIIALILWLDRIGTGEHPEPGGRPGLLGR